MTATEIPSTWETTSVGATHALGAALGGVLVGGLTIGLVGPLGAGKTHLVKGIAAGNGAADARQITSPTFTLIHEHPGRLRLVHADAYRLRGPAELIALGFDELVASDAVVVVEWADRVHPAMPADTLWIELTAVSESGRRMAFHSDGPLARRCLDAFRRDYPTLPTPI